MTDSKNIEWGEELFTIEPWPNDIVAQRMTEGRNVSVTPEGRNVSVTPKVVKVIVVSELYVHFNVVKRGEDRPTRLKIDRGFKTEKEATAAAENAVVEIEEYIGELKEALVDIRLEQGDKS